MAKIALKGKVIAPGIARGELCFITIKFDSPASAENVPRGDVGDEIARFENKVVSVINELEEAVRVLRKDSFFEEGEIIQTHVLLLKDDAFHQRVHEQIKTNRLAAEIALEHVLQEMVAVFERSKSLVFSEMAADIKDIMMRLKRKLTREDHIIFNAYLKNIENPVVVAKELLPSFVLEAKEGGVNAFLIEKGTTLSHAAILAKSFGIPVLQVDNLFACGLRKYRTVFVDAIKGIVLLDPGDEEISEAYRPLAPAPVMEKKHLPVKIWINIVDPLQVSEKDLECVAGIGLYRTEVLFMRKEDDFPTEEEQLTIYSSLFDKFEDRPITVRTLDIGGDKTLPYFSFGPQENPYLGFRAHRIYRFHPEIFINQIKALLKAGINARELRILYPMIESVDELLFVQDLLGQAINTLKDEGVRYKEDFLQGILMEVPSAVWGFKDLLQYVDFASVGTNDLLQYFFAVDRDNANVCRSYQPENPVFLDVLKYLIDTARELNKPLSICGEMAADLRMLPLLIGLGFENISIDFHSVPRVRNYLSTVDVSTCTTLAQECLKATKTAEVKGILQEFTSCKEEDEPRNTGDDGSSVDPICKMVIQKEGNELFVSRGGKTYYFCTRQCRDKFTRT